VPARVLSRSPEARCDMTTRASDVRLFEPVSDLQLPAAIDRAERHSQAKGVQRGRIAEHLGFARSPSTTRRLRPQVEKLVAAGALVRLGRYGSNVWVLTRYGRERVARARRDGKDLGLPESPQHRRWRYAREEATRRIGEFGEELRLTLKEAQGLLASEGHAQAWSQMSVRLRQQSALLGWALYCQYEWAEPDDAQPDIDVVQRRRELQLVSSDLIAVLPLMCRKPRLRARGSAR
jgi:hypothetical protein